MAKYVRIDGCGLIFSISNESDGETPYEPAVIVRDDFSGNPDLLDAESRHALSLVEQLEVALAKTARKNDVSIRTNATDEVPDEHKEIVADYYRKLGQAEDNVNQ